MLPLQSLQQYKTGYSLDPCGELLAGSWLSCPNARETQYVFYSFDFRRESHLALEEAGFVAAVSSHTFCRYSRSETCLPSTLKLGLLLILLKIAAHS